MSCPPRRVLAAAVSIALGALACGCADHVQEVTLRVDDGFVPVVPGGGFGERDLELTTARPAGLTSEPPVWGTRRYGRLPLGPKGFLFALDMPDGAMLVDRNQNGDLTDDGSRRGNQGSGTKAFATTVRLPLGAVVPSYEGAPADYELWFFVRDLEAGHAAFYAKTRLRGKVALGGATYDVELSDSGPVDGDFTNDGVLVDLDRDGQFDAAKEWFRPGQTATVEGKRYRFAVSQTRPWRPPLQAFAQSAASGAAPAPAPSAARTSAPGPRVDVSLASAHLPARAYWSSKWRGALLFEEAEGDVLYVWIQGHHGATATWLKKSETADPLEKSRGIRDGVFSIAGQLRFGVGREPARTLERLTASLGVAFPSPSSALRWLDENGDFLEWDEGASKPKLNEARKAVHLAEADRGLRVGLRLDKKRYRPESQSR